MKFIRKFFGWTLTYKTLAFIEGVYTYIKDYYYISDTLYSDEFKAVIKRYLYITLSKDWIGRLYGIINPNIDINSLPSDYFDCMVKTSYGSTEIGDKGIIITKEEFDKYRDEVEKLSKTVDGLVAYL